MLNEFTISKVSLKRNEWEVRTLALPCSFLLVGWTYRGGGRYTNATNWGKRRKYSNGKLPLSTRFSDPNHTELVTCHTSNGTEL